jgi:LAO/AO transport system kinase
LIFFYLWYMDQQHLDDWLRKRRGRRSQMTAGHLFPRLRNGDMEALSTAITLVESTLDRDRHEAEELVQLSLPFAENSIRLGITGVPGVGKSTFIESFGQLIAKKGLKVAVLTIDPSSAESGGSILGDKTRMPVLSVHPNVFIRPSAAGQTLGGVARKTRETVFLCEAAGFDVIIIETVGVGQSETLVHSMVDFFLLLMLSGAGDELQGIKRGIMEMADALVITKADGDNITRSELAAREYANAMHLFPPKKSKWTPSAFTCSSMESRNIDKVWSTVESYVLAAKANGWWTENRKIQDKYWLKETLKEMILSEFFDDPEMIHALREEEEKVMQGGASSFAAAENLYKMFKGRSTNK